MHRTTLATFAVSLINLFGLCGCLPPSPPSYELESFHDEFVNVSVTRMEEYCEATRLFHEGEPLTFGEPRLRPVRQRKQGSVSYWIEIEWHDWQLAHSIGPVRVHMKELILLVDGSRHVIPVQGRESDSGFHSRRGFWVSEKGHFLAKEILLEVIARASTVKMRLIGYEDSITARLTEECLTGFRVFYRAVVLGEQEYQTEADQPLAK